MLAVTAPRSPRTPHRVRLGRSRCASRSGTSRWALVLVLALPQITYLLTRPWCVVPRGRAGAVPSDARAQPPRRGAVPHGALLLGLRGQLGGHDQRLERARARPLGARRQRTSPSSPRCSRASCGRRCWWALDAACAASATREGLYFVLFYVWCAVSTMGKGPAGLAIPGAVAGFLHHGRVALGRLAHPARRRVAGVPRRGHALVRRDLRAPGQRVHPALRGARHHQPHGGGRARRHRLAAVLPVAARLRDVPLVGPRAGRAARLARRSCRADATRAQRDVARIGSCGSSWPSCSSRR
jgi:hypothetical protein